MSPLANSLIIALASTAIACVLGLLAAFALLAVQRSAFSVQRSTFAPLLALSVLPILVPSYVIVSFWMEALGAGGWLSQLIAGGHAVSLTGLWPTVLVLALIYWSPVALICYFTLTRIDRAMIEAAELSLGKCRANLRVVAPLLWPSIAMGAALVFVLTFSNFSVPAMFQVRSIQNEIYVQFNANFDAGKALIAALPQLIAAIVLLWIVGRMLRGRPWIAVSGRSSGMAAMDSRFTVVRPRGSRLEARLHRLLGLGFLTGLLILSAIGPITRSVAAVFHGKVLWQTLVVSAHQIWNSFWFAFVAATIVMFWSAAACCRFPIARLVERRRPTRQQAGGRESGSKQPHSKSDSRLLALDSLLLIPFVLPEVLIGIALIAIFNRPSLQFIYTSIVIILIALVVRYFVVGKLAVSVGRSHVDPSLLEAAQLAGLSRFSMLFRIQLPLLSRWLFTGWWLVYLFCLADVGSLVLIYPPGCDTVSIRIFNLLHYGYDAQVSVLCLVMLVLGALPLFMWPRMTRSFTNDRVQTT
ncbi:MAG: iron ABC transporter permease [Verrucomicrobiae bacterium]|nr:iron ABC transporter permease [Verrucomicrobiae bacterium]